MKKADLEFIGTSVSGHDEDYWISDDDYLSFGACGLMSKVDALSVDWHDLFYFETNITKELAELSEDADDYDRKTLLKIEADVQKYRAQHNRFCPPVYRIKLSVEAEEVSEEEAAKFWRKRMKE